MSKRKPYVREMTPTWWAGNPFYVRYMIREASCLFVLGYALVLLSGVVALGQGADAFNQFLEGLRSPAAIVFHVATLLMTLYHTVTFLKMTPKTMRLELGGKKVEDSKLIVVEYLAFAVASVVIIAVLMGA